MKEIKTIQIIIFFNSSVYRSNIIYLLLLLLMMTCLVKKRPAESVNVFPSLSMNGHKFRGKRSKNSLHRHAQNILSFPRPAMSWLLFGLM